jgi:uncharacterized hydrophobic protein (TIGR00341 family)
VRLVQVMVPTGKRESVTGVLEEEGIDYVLTDEDSSREYTAVVYFPLPTSAVEPVLDRLREVGLERDAYTVVLEANTVVSQRFEALEERYDDGEASEDRVARDEIRSGAAELLPGRTTYLLLATISAIVATAGLLLDSPAVVVGSMVIAPVLGPALATNVGTVIQDDELFREGVKMQLVGFATAMVAATAFAVLVRTAYLVPPGLDVASISQVQGRLSPDFLSLAVALGAGAAGALSLSSGVSAALVGVMIAAALIPPMATVGIGIAWGLPEVVVGAGVLVVVNALAVNLATLVVFWLKNYRPERWFDRSDARLATLRRGATLVLALAVVSAFLVGVTLSSFQAATSDEQIRTEVEAALGETAYAEATLIGVDVHRERDIVGSRLTGVVVTVGRPADRSYPDLAGELNRRIESVVGEDVPVQLQFVVTVEE